ncbi:MAG: hypothetical protein JXR39_08715 [Marinilabiliaceae bacterium]|nr:hypothetical protein [Marinilabiliaceae bacterium]
MMRSNATQTATSDNGQSCRFLPPFLNSLILKDLINLPLHHSTTYHNHLAGEEHP